MVVVYGLIEKFELSRWGVIPVHVKEEHPELQKILTSISDSKVGLELDESFKRSRKYESVLIETPLIHMNIYNQLRKNNKIIPLEETCVIDEYAEATLKLLSMKETSTLEQFKQSVIVDHFHKIIRDDMIRRNVKANNLDFVFVGGAHAHNLSFVDGFENVFLEIITNQSAVEKYANMAFSSATSEKKLDSLLKKAPAIKYSFVNAKELKDYEKNDEVYALEGLEQVRRLHSIITTGRIDTKKVPDYVGSWSLSGVYPPIYGLFEMFIQKNDSGNIEGVIKDVLGDASFKGVVDEGRLFFSKIYTRVYDENTFLNVPIDYSSLKSNNIPTCFEGRYALPDTNGGDFLIAPYSPKILSAFTDSENSSEIIKTLKKNT